MMMLQLNSLRKNEYQVILGRSGHTGRPNMVGCLATRSYLAKGGSLSWSDYGRFDSHSVLGSEILSDSLIGKPNRPQRTKYALFSPGGNRKLEV
jgi:hypothetical protein